MQVNGPDGKVYNFPDDVSDTELTQFFSPPAPKQPSTFDKIKKGAKAVLQEAGDAAEGLRATAGMVATLPIDIGNYGGALVDSLVQEDFSKENIDRNVDRRNQSVQKLKSFLNPEPVSERGKAIQQTAGNALAAPGVLTNKAVTAVGNEVINTEDYPNIVPNLAGAASVLADVAVPLDIVAGVKAARPKPIVERPLGIGENTTPSNFQMYNQGPLVRPAKPSRYNQEPVLNDMPQQPLMLPEPPRYAQRRADIEAASNDLAAQIAEAKQQPSGWANHENLAGDTVITARDSMMVAPEKKPVVKGTVSEVQEMGKTGELNPREHQVFYPDGKTDPNGVAYIIRKQAIDRPIEAVKQELRMGGDAESRWLGYPNRTNVPSNERATVAVTKQGEVVTEPLRIQQESADKNLQWSAEGEPTEVVQKANDIVGYKGMQPSSSGKSTLGEHAGFFTSSEEVAQRFADGQKGKVYTANLNIEKPFIIDAKGKEAGEFRYTSEFERALDDPQYDGIIIKNTSNEADVFIPKNKSQVQFREANEGAKVGDTISPVEKTSPESNLEAISAVPETTDTNLSVEPWGKKFAVRLGEGENSKLVQTGISKKAAEKYVADNKIVDLHLGLHPKEIGRAVKATYDLASDIVPPTWQDRITNFISLPQRIAASGKHPSFSKAYEKYRTWEESRNAITSDLYNTVDAKRMRELQNNMSAAEKAELRQVLKKGELDKRFFEKEDLLSERNPLGRPVSEKVADAYKSIRDLIFNTAMEDFRQTVDTSLHAYNEKPWYNSLKEWFDEGLTSEEISSFANDYGKLVDREALDALDTVNEVKRYIEEEVVKNLKEAKYSVSDVRKREVRKNPYPPFPNFRCIPGFPRNFPLKASLEDSRNHGPGAHREPRWQKNCPRG